ncbi:hypothetical protein KO02_19495 [Sphingobacterium sp. ML3W]|uniref:hypothetical protein n=1 Tax=Sphingobacterium sp. ML3W TaxID=1538644 RepID=UPI0004F86CD7|nr:hypothetical protein [Sphingobacterium sp. ML3W]AIM38636.1 hypothetical protein KO02_19495 [Sphingobacterium sp. ML3W]
MKNIIKIILVGGLLVFTINFFFNKSTEELAKEVCDCYKTVRKIQNFDEKLKKGAECKNLYMDNLDKVNEIASDMDYEQTKQEMAKFTLILEKCQ